MLMGKIKLKKREVTENKKEHKVTEKGGGNGLRCGESHVPIVTGRENWGQCQQVCQHGVSTEKFLI